MNVSKVRGENGFTVVEAAIVIVIIAVIVGVGIYVTNKNTNKSQPVSSTTSISKPNQVTSISIDQTTTMDVSKEMTTDSSADGTYLQDSSSVNGAISNVGGAYNESSY